MSIRPYAPCPAYLSKDYHRMWDLVRYHRAELHDAGLITREEYVALVSEEPSMPGTGSPSARRLGSYDEIRDELDAALAARDEAFQRAEQAEAALAQAQAERDSLIKRLDFWIECNNGERANGRMPTFLNPYTILLWIGDKRVAAEADAAQPHALPPLPPDWHERYGDTWVGFYYLEYDEDTGSQIVATRLGVDVDTIGTVNVSDLITVLRHAEAAHQRLKEGQ